MDKVMDLLKKYWYILAIVIGAYFFMGKKNKPRRKRYKKRIRRGYRYGKKKSYQAYRYGKKKSYQAYRYGRKKLKRYRR